MNKTSFIIIFALIFLVFGGNVDIHFLLEVDAEFTSELANVEFPLELTMIFPALCKKSKNDSPQK